MGIADLVGIFSGNAKDSPKSGFAKIQERIERDLFSFVRSWEHSDSESLYSLEQALERSLDPERPVYKGMSTFSRQDGADIHRVQVASFEDGSYKIIYSCRTSGSSSGLVEVDAGEFLRRTKDMRLVDFFGVKAEELRQVPAGKVNETGQIPPPDQRSPCRVLWEMVRPAPGVLRRIGNRFVPL